MAASVFDSPMYHRLFDAGEARRLFSDAAEVRAMLLVEGALAKVQGKLGVIPSLSGAAIHRASIEITLDPGGLAAATGQNGVCVPELVTAFRREMQAPEHAQYMHWGATSQDIIDTGLMLRLRQVLTLCEDSLKGALADLSSLAKAHADTPMAGRTFGQHATPTTFGATVAGWGAPLIGLLEELEAVQKDCLLVSLSGAAGTGAALGQMVETRAALAEALDLTDPQRSWHTDRTPVLRITDWLTRLAIACAKMGQDLTLLTQTEIQEVDLGAAGSSSTMPQKQNPVAPSAVVSLKNLVTGAQGTLQSTSNHGFQRDGAAWMTEWMMVPQIALGSVAALTHIAKLAGQISPNTDQMRINLGRTHGAIHAEALSFALATNMPRPEAQAKTKELCQAAQETGKALSELTQDAFPDLDTSFFDPALNVGEAPALAKAFAAKVASLT